MDIEGPHPVEPGDTFLLCSDGLTGVVPPEDIGAVVTALPPDEAARLLVNLANLRGGPDNITVLIVKVGGGAEDSLPGKSSRKGPAGRLLAAWNRLVPWPFTAIGAGCAFAALSLLMHANDVPGAAVLFLLAAVAVLGGLVGLALHVQKEQPEHEPVDEGPRQLNVYKRHDCPVSKALVEKFQQIETALIEAMQSQGTAADWAAHEKLAAFADAEWKKGNDLAAFRGRCRALLFLTDAFHKARNKEETFRPSWTSPTRA